ncbi:MAG: hypothetical protein H8D84_02710 [Proteobacteria bacterium]|nr:hypothetical protein [Pseudomonadota bacterium]
MAIILPANTLSAGGYTVANSCRFNDGDSPYMHVTRGSAGNQKTFTISMWIKRCELGASNYFFSAGPDGDTNFAMYFNSSDLLEIWQYSSAAYQFRFKPTRVFRDVSAWYHICLAIDTTDSTADDRMKIYINGVQETTITTRTNPSENLDTIMNDDRKYWLGNYVGTSNYFDGYIAELVVLDGTAASPTSFGEFDEDSPTIWKPIDVSGLTFGTNGFYLDFEDSANLGNDANGGTDWTEVNLAATDQATDTPTNNFCVLNPLDNEAANVLSEGNLQTQSTTSNKSWVMGTFAVSSGKWYWEAKLTATGGTHSSDKWNLIGISDHSAIGATDDLGLNNYEYAIYEHDGTVYPSGSAATYAASWAVNDIIGVALDCDNNKIYFSKNGQWSNGSGSWDSTTFNSATGAITIQAPASTATGNYHPAWGDGGINVNKTWQFNFGSPVHSISSGNSDGNGYGNFEYAVPSGYFAMNSKNLGAYGG